MLKKELIVTGLIYSWKISLNLVAARAVSSKSNFLFIFFWSVMISQVNPWLLASKRGFTFLFILKEAGLGSSFLSFSVPFILTSYLFFGRDIYLGFDTDEECEGDLDLDLSLFLWDFFFLLLSLCLWDFFLSDFYYELLLGIAKEYWYKKNIFIIIEVA